MVFCLAADDQWCASLIDQNRVHFVNNGEIQPPLHPVSNFVNHVVTQVVKTIFIVGAVGDVCLVGGLFFFARHVGQVDANRQAQKVVELTHPARVATGQIVVDGDHMNAFACQRVQIDGQRCGECFTFAGSHLRNFSVVKRHTTQQLDIKVTHLHDTFAALAHHRKSFGKYLFQRLAVTDALFQILRFLTQFVIAQFFVIRLERIDLLNRFTVGFEQPFVAAAKNFGQDVGGHTFWIARSCAGERRLQPISLN